MKHLFLLGLVLLSLGLSTLLTDTNEAGLRASVTELPVRSLLTLVVADGALLECDGVLDGQDSGGGAEEVALLGSLDVCGGSVTLLRLAVSAREEDEALLVLGKTLHVGLEALLRDVLATGINSDTDGRRELARDAGLYSNVSQVQNTGGR